MERQDLHARLRGSYGIDAPYVPGMLGAAGMAFLVLGVVGLVGGIGWGAFGPLLASAFFLLSAASYLYTTWRGKFDAWSDVLDDLSLRGDEHVLDMGCGRGAVLLLAARRVPAGRVVGVDLWRSVDQSGNSEDATAGNARAEGVADRVELHTGDMRALPFRDGEFDLVLSGLAVHNIPTADGRATAVAEAARVTRPGGRIALVDFRHLDDYRQRLADCGIGELETRGLGWRFWYGGPWTSGKLVRGVKPGSPPA